MDVIEKITKESEKAVEVIKFNIVYIPGSTIEEDMYNCKIESINLSVYGQTESEAIVSARKELVARMIEDSVLRERIIKEHKNKFL